MKITNKKVFLQYLRKQNISDADYIKGEKHAPYLLIAFPQFDIFGANDPKLDIHCLL